MIEDSNSATKTPRPVTDWENAAVSMHALCCQSLWEDHKRDVEQLRERQARYEESLPTEPDEAFQALRRLMHPDGDEYPDGFTDALHLVAAVEELARNGDLDVIPTRKSLVYLAEKAVECLNGTRNSLDRIGDILSASRRRTDKNVEEFLDLTKEFTDGEKRGLTLAMKATLDRGVPIKEALAIFDEVAKEAALVASEERPEAETQAASGGEEAEKNPA